LNIEEAKFLKTLDEGTRQFEKIVSKNPKVIPGQIVFDLFATHGFPMEMTKEMAEQRGVKIDEEGYRVEFEKHQEVSRAGINEKKFAGGLSDKEDPLVVGYHTAAHLLLAGLRRVLGDHVHQKGSNITEERLRFDFSHPEKMTDEQKIEVEQWVNDQISKKLEVKVLETTPKQAKELGAEGEFMDKYGDSVKVYSIGGELGSLEAVSAEICGGPHVANTSELGRFKIVKEESSSSGVRRIKAIFE
jgi:alanyl-tRNA synthetase